MRIKLNVVSCTNTTLHEAIIEQGLDRIIFPVDLDKIRTVHELKWKICQFYEDKLNSIGSYKEVHTVKFTIVSLTYEGFNLVDEFEIKDLLKTDDELK